VPPAVAALLCMSVVITAEVFYVKDVLHAGDAVYALVTAAWMAGMVAGALGLVGRVPTAAMATAALTALMVQGLGIAAGDRLGDRAGRRGRLAGRGRVGHGLKNALLRTLIQQRVRRPRPRPRVRRYNAARNAAELGALAAGGVLVAAVGARQAVLIAGLGSRPRRRRRPAPGQIPRSSRCSNARSDPGRARVARRALGKPRPSCPQRRATPGIARSASDPTLRRPGGPRLGASRAEGLLRIGGHDHELLDAGFGVHQGIVPARRATTTGSRSTATRSCPTPARAGSPRACAARRGSSTRASSAAAAGRSSSRPPSSTSCTSGRSRPRAPSTERSAPAGARRPRRHRDRDHAGRRVPRRHGWGYDGVYLSAAHSAYGGPHAFRRLVDAAHAAGLGVVLDVVYNHLGASGVRAMEAFGPYFTDKHETFWGKAINFDDEDCDPVREWAIQSACFWVGELGRRRPAPRRDPRDQRRGALHILTELAAACTRRTRARSSSPSPRSTTRASSARGESAATATTRSGPTTSTTACARC
jgi:hypothetical protein